MDPLCIYHGNCADGFGAAWVVRERFRENGLEIEFHAGVYQNEPPDVTGRDVILVDFSYKRTVLEEMARVASSVLVIDHHKTAADDLADFISVSDWLVANWNSGLTEPSWFNTWLDHASNGIATIFDMDRSGAGLTWDVLFPNRERPRLIDHIEDRDLWRFALPETREIQAAVFSYPYDFGIWTWLMTAAPLDQLVLEGRAIERKHHKDIAELTQVVTRPMKIAGHVVPMANLPYTLTSDAGHLLCGEVQSPPHVGGPTISAYPFAGCYWDTPDGRVFSLRSRDDGFDVGEIAKSYGGGGHKHASGFRVPFDQLDQFNP